MTKGICQLGTVEILPGKGEILATLRKEAKKSDKVYLATDPDRVFLHALKLEAVDERSCAGHGLGSAGPYGWIPDQLLWAGLSAGRVQSVARISADREEEIAFIPEEYWSLDAD